MRLAADLIGVAVVCYLAVLAGLYIFQRNLLYGPDQSRPQLGALAQLGTREVTITTADGLSLLAWYLPPREGRPVIAYFHGNGGNIGYRAERLRRFGDAGFGVLMPEYRGYGGNPGSPSEAGIFADAAAALAFLKDDGIVGDRVTLYGESLGSGVAVHLAAETPVRAVVLESPYTSVAEVAQYHYPYIPARLLIWDRFDSLSEIGRIHAPLLVLSGGRDRIVPAAFSRQLFDAAPEPKQMFFAPDAGHVNLERFGGLDAAIYFIERMQ
jgi:hypothetical protein